MLLSLPSPVPRKGQKIYKADIWEHNRQARENEQAFASLVPALARQHRPANQAQSTPTDAQMQMNTRRVASLEIIPHLKHLLQSTFVRSLPPFATALVQDLSSLAILKATENTSGVLDEHDIGGDDDNDDEPSTAHNAEQSSINTDDWFLDEDDIDDHA